MPLDARPTLPSSARPTRRSVARGAAWAVPVIAVGAAAPALAASPGACPSLPPFSEADGWTLDVTGTGGGEASFVGEAFFMNTDPGVGQTVTATASHSLEVVSGRSYQFSYSYEAFTGWNTPMAQELLVDGLLVPGSRFDTNSSGDSGSRSVVWVSPATGTVTFSVRDSITYDGNVYGDDIAAYPITVTCL